MAIYKISQSGGSGTPVTPAVDPTKNGLPVLPVFLPDGRHFIFHSAQLGTGKGAVFTATLDSPGAQPKQLAEIPNLSINGDSPMIYASPGYLLFTRDRHLMAQPFDVRSLQTTGTAQAIAENVSGTFSVSQNGTVVYRPSSGADASSTTARKLLWLDRSGKTAGEIPAPAAIGSLEISQDGEFVAMDSNGVQSSTPAIWVVDRSGRAQKLTATTAFHGYPVWHALGKWIAFATNESLTSKLYQKAANGIGREELLLDAGVPAFPRDWSDDGKYLVYEQWETNFQHRHIWVLPTFGDRKPYALLQNQNSPSSEFEAQISPDGRFIAFVSNETGRDQIVVRTFPDSRDQWPVTRDGGIEPRWKRNGGGELYFIAPNGKMMTVSVITSTDKFSAGTPVELFPIPSLSFQTTPFLRRYDVSADGQKFLFAVASDAPAGGATTTPIIAIVNWPRALKNNR